MDPIISHLIAALVGALGGLMAARKIYDRRNSQPEGPNVSIKSGGGPGNPPPPPVDPGTGGNPP